MPPIQRSRNRRALALGVTLSTPDTDRVSYSVEELQAKITVALGGRVAEEIMRAAITTGAESDIQQLTQIARQEPELAGCPRASATPSARPALGVELGVVCSRRDARRHAERLIIATFGRLSCRPGMFVGGSMVERSASVKSRFSVVRR